MEKAYILYLYIRFSDASIWLLEQSINILFILMKQVFHEISKRKYCLALIYFCIQVSFVLNTIEGIHLHCCRWGKYSDFVLIIFLIDIRTCSTKLASFFDPKKITAGDSAAGVAKQVNSLIYTISNQGNSKSLIV